MARQIKPCPEGKILNTATGRCVTRTGAIGRKILASQQNVRRSKEREVHEDREEREDRLREIAINILANEGQSVRKAMMKKIYTIKHPEQEEHQQINVSKFGKTYHIDLYYVRYGDRREIEGTITENGGEKLRFLA